MHYTLGKQWTDTSNGTENHDDGSDRKDMYLLHKLKLVQISYEYIPVNGFINPTNTASIGNCLMCFIIA